MFEYTRKEFWGGPSIPYWILAIFTVLFGFLGFDHLLLRSPSSAITKFITNIFTLGLWYFYDIVQIIGDKEKVMNYGLTAPLYGPLGIGAGMFTDNQPDVPKSKSPWRFLLYCMLVFLPFGFDSFIGGDTAGGVIKFICTIIPIFWPILLFWMFYSIGRLYIFPEPLFTEGIDRPFPVGFFVSKKGTSVLGPKTVPEPSNFGCDSSSGEFLSILPPFVRAAIMYMFPTFIPTVQSGLFAAKTGANAASAGFTTAKIIAEETADTAKKVSDSTKKIINAATNVATSAASVIPQGVKKGPEIGSNVTGSLLKQFTNPNEILKQVGGSYEMAENSTLSNTVLLAGFGIILMGGVYYGLKRLNNSATSLFRKDESRLDKGGKGRKWDDSPPQPSGS
jgi:hypothetical protein